MSHAEIIMLSMLAILIAAFYGRLISRITKGWTELEKAPGDIHPEVKISVLVPFRNEKENIIMLMEALRQQDYPVELFEVILINDHSNDGGDEAARLVGNTSSIQCLDLPEGMSGKKRALQLGIDHAGGQLIVTTDADCRPGKGWLSSIASYYSRWQFKMIAGPVAIADPKGFMSKFQALEFTSLVASGAGAIKSVMPIMCNGANLAYEKSAFEEVGGFRGNEHIAGGDDIFLLEKFKKKFGSRQIGFAKDRQAIVYTDAAKDLKHFLNQRFRWVSKSPAYRDPAMILTAVLVLLVNLGLLTTLVWGFWSPEMLMVFGVMFLLKCLIDLPILWNATGFFDQRKLMAWYLPFQFIYFIFVSLVGILGNIIPYRWKNKGPQRSADL